MAGTVIDTSSVNLDALRKLEEQLGGMSGGGIVTSPTTPIPVPIQNYEPRPNIDTSIPIQNQKELYRNVQEYVVPLPSQGLLYNSNNPWHNVSQVTMRKIVTQDADILSSKRLLNEGTVFVTLLNRLISTPGLDSNKLFNGDQFALIIAARIKSIGEIYNPGDTYTYTCEFCDNVSSLNFNLSKLTVVDNSSKFIHQDNIFTIKLPESGDTIQVKILTIEEEKFVAENIAAANRQQAMTGIDVTESVTLKHHIISINGDTDMSNISQHVDWLSLTDKEYVNQFLDEVEPKIDFKQDVQCKVCNGFMKEIRIPFTDRFFRPKIKIA